ncbi:DUF6311 domain-containing protein [Caulobacter sp. 1776]|uniref:DUF6311 domain-containing protein n=1 Tax=Caulobacter sp. 1776 TaxID=3156420 RepID=UPI003396E391
MRQFESMAKGGMTLGRIAFALAATAIPILLCGFMFGFDIPLASAKFWTLPKGDMAAMTAAWEAFARQPWCWPLTTVTGLTDKPVSLVFTDSIPWLALLLKATGLSGVFTPVGLFLFLSYPLQVWGMVGLLRALGVADRWILLLGGLLALVFPAWIARQFGHIALSGHWILLLAVTLSVRAAREGLTWARAGGFAGLLALAAGVHAYHLVPIVACFGAAALSELVQRRSGAWLRVPAALALASAALGIAVWLLDYKDGLGMTGGAAALGFYSMNLVGPVWPQASALAGQAWTGDWFPDVVDATGGQSFEGFQYLGAGVLALVLGMAGFETTLAVRRRGVSAAFWIRWTPMLLAMAVLTLWALGWSVYAFKTHLYDLPKPSGDLAEKVGGLRAHGRFFWTVGYLLLALGVTWTSRLPRRTGLAVLTAALALQAVDTSPLRTGVRHVFAEPDWIAYPRALTDSPATAGRPWVFAPAYFCSPSQRDLRAIKQMTLAIVRNGGTSNTFATARNNDPPCDPPNPMILNDAAPGDRRITVVMRNEQPRGGFMTPIAQRSDCFWFGRGIACGRDLRGLKGLRPLRPGELAQRP